MKSLDWVSTGVPGLDETINHLRTGDNVVLQVDSIEEYIKFVEPFVRNSVNTGKRVVYMRFARHKPIVPPHDSIAVYEINADNGFESFTTQVHEIITAEGEGTFYVFDCLSDLLFAWATDLMVGNFFAVTCPYLFKLNTVSYFALYRNSNSFQTIAAIRDTTQILLDIYRINGNTCIHPLKVWNRYSPTMFLPHIDKDSEFVPVTNSGDAAKLFADLARNRFGSSKRNLDYWDRLFLSAADLYTRQKGKEQAASKQKKLVEKLCKVVISRDEKMFSLATRFLSLEDLLNIKSRLIGSGYIGGKAVGMLIARKVLMEDPDTDWDQLLERHDSFYIGSDVFYTYLVQNGLWNLRVEQRKPKNYFKAAGGLKEKMLKGRFPENIRDQFIRMLEYFGQSPIIVRSSSLLEDGFGNAFAGKYESVFCINQGTIEERYHRFEEAVRRIFSSTMNEDALNYRLKRGLDQQDEQMALLVQRVSGAYRKQYFFPEVAGVGFSYNTYVWEKQMNPEAGMLRIVMGLGTRAVNRMEGDYARIAALDNPLLKPYAGIADYKRFSQREVDVLNIQENRLQSMPLQSLINEKLELNLHKIAERDYDAEKKMRELGREQQPLWTLTFDKLLSSTTFSGVMLQMLKKLEKAYQYPVDIEFTVNFKGDETYQINLLQCRPLQVKGLKAKVVIPQNIGRDKIFFQTQGNFMGGNVYKPVRRIIYVDAETYSCLKQQDKYEVARAVGKLNRLIGDKENEPTLLLGPGRWGTTTPSLGVPVTFSEINNMTVLCEVADLNAGFCPDLSFGTHFFQDLVESDIFYVALFVGQKGVVLQKEVLDSYQSILSEVLPENGSLRDVLKVYNVDRGLQVAADVAEQKVVCFLGNG